MADSSWLAEKNILDFFEIISHILPFQFCNHFRLLLFRVFNNDSGNRLYGVRSKHYLGHTSMYVTW